MSEKNRIEVCLYALHNYRNIYREFLEMKRGSKEYEETKRYLDIVNSAVSALQNSRTLNLMSRPAISGYSGGVKELYYDVLYLSYLCPDPLTSDEIIEKINSKYKVSISAVKLSKLKKRAAVALSGFFRTDP